MSGFRLLLWWRISTRVCAALFVALGTLLGLATTCAVPTVTVGRLCLQHITVQTLVRNRSAFDCADTLAVVCSTTARIGKATFVCRQPQL